MFLGIQLGNESLHLKDQTVLTKELLTVALGVPSHGCMVGEGCKVLGVISSLQTVNLSSHRFEDPFHKRADSAAKNKASAVFLHDFR
jgi:hypothetical protein